MDRAMRRRLRKAKGYTADAMKGVVIGSLVLINTVTTVESFAAVADRRSEQTSLKADDWKEKSLLTLFSVSAGPLEASITGVENAGMTRTQEPCSNLNIPSCKLTSQIPGANEKMNPWQYLFQLAGTLGVAAGGASAGLYDTAIGFKRVMANSGNDTEIETKPNQHPLRAPQRPIRPNSRPS